MAVPANIPAPMMAANALAPIVVASASGSEDSTTTSHTVNLPASVAVGELLLAVLAMDGDTTISWGGGWTEVLDIVNSPNDVRLSVAYKQAAGGETSVTVTSGTSKKSAFATYRISGHKNPASQAPEASTGATGSDAAPDPDTITPTGGFKNYLFLAATAMPSSSRVATAAPAGYGNLIALEATPAATCGVASAEKQDGVSSEDPGTFTIPGSDDWVAATIAIHPA